MMSSGRTEALFARGDVVTIADRDVEFAGKPRPALVLQSPHFATLALTVCAITSIAVDAPLLRIALPASGVMAPSPSDRRPHWTSRRCEDI
jgi:mRNA-degrading endonuclease toxin of MazEF toxin-antitoxin module